MKTQILKLTNSLLASFGVEITPTFERFSMKSAIQRTHKHGICFNSVIDLGASNGQWSLKAMETFPDVSYLAVEALYEREDSLKKNRKEYANFDYIICAAGNKNNITAELNIAEDLDGSTINGSGGSSREVPMRSIDSIVSEKKLKGPYFLKFDTHGFELPIIEGATSTLSETSVIVMEVYNFDITDHAKRFPEMCLYLEGLGFRCYDMADPMLRIHDNTLWQMDLFFCRKNSIIFQHTQYK